MKTLKICRTLCIISVIICLLKMDANIIQHYTKGLHCRFSGGSIICKREV